MSYKEVMNTVNKEALPMCVLLHGDEDYLLDKAVGAVKEKYIQKDYEDMNYLELEKIDDDFDSFTKFVSVVPFMSEKKMCVIKDSHFLTSTGSLNKVQEDKLIDIIEDKDGSCIIVFMIKGSKADARKKIFKKLKDKKGVFEIAKLNEGELTRLISDFFKKNKIDISMGDTVYIANCSGYLEYESIISLYDVYNELDKLCAYGRELKKIEREDIDNLMIISVESNIFKLVDYICEGRKDKALVILEEMILNNTPEQYIIHMIIRQYRMLYQYISLQNKGYSQDRIADVMKLKKFVATKLSKLSRNLTAKKIEGYMNKFLELDMKIKTGQIDKTIGLEIIANGIIN